MFSFSLGAAFYNTSVNVWMRSFKCFFLIQHCFCYTLREWVNCRMSSSSGVFVKMVLTHHGVMKQRERRIAGLCLRTSFRQTAEFHLSAFNQGRIGKLGLSGQEGCKFHHSAPFHIVVHLSFSRTTRCIELPPKMKGNSALCFSVM